MYMPVMSGFVVLERLAQAGCRLSSSPATTVLETLTTWLFCSSVRVKNGPTQNGVKTVVILDKKCYTEFQFNNLENNQYETKIAQINYDVGYLIARISELSRY